jgi:hypothetical protein
MINTLNLSLSEAESGLIIRFSKPNNLTPDTLYNIYFDSVVSLPANPPSTVSFVPENGSYTVLGSSIGSPQVWLKIQSSHTVQTKTLIRLTIKNTNNVIVHTDYLLIVASPSDTVTFEGTILQTNSSGNIGPNGGRILEIVNTNQSTSAVAVGDVITGPGIPDNIVVTIRSVLSSSRIELLETPSEEGAVIDGGTYSGTYSIIRQVGCVNPLDQEYFQLGSQYTVLDYTNNWTFYVKNKILAKLVIDDPVAQENTVMLLPIKNVALISDPDVAPVIPALSVMKIGGRVRNNSIPVTEL